MCSNNHYSFEGSANNRRKDVAQSVVLNGYKGVCTKNEEKKDQMWTA